MDQYVNVLCAATSVESSFRSQKIPLHSTGIDINRPEISRLLKQARNYILSLCKLLFCDLFLI